MKPLEYETMIPFRHFIRHRRFILSVIPVVVLLGLLVPQASARHRHVKVKDRTYTQAYDEIQSVDLTAHTVTIATMNKTVDIDKHLHHHHTTSRHQKQASEAAHTQKVITLRVTNITEIEVYGQKRDFSALSRGMKVDVTKGTDETEASRLVVTQ